MRSVSQERLNDEDFTRIKGYFDSPVKHDHYFYAFTADMTKMIAEIERLQAVEAERDRYKAALEEMQWYPQGNALIHVQNIKHVAKQALEGADTQ